MDDADSVQMREENHKAFIQTAYRGASYALVGGTKAACDEFTKAELTEKLDS